MPLATWTISRDELCVRIDSVRNLDFHPLLTINGEIADQTTRVELLRRARNGYRFFEAWVLYGEEEDAWRLDALEKVRVRRLDDYRCRIRTITSDRDSVMQDERDQPILNESYVDSMPYTAPYTAAPSLGNTFYTILQFGGRGMVSGFLFRVTNNAPQTCILTLTDERFSNYGRSEESLSVAVREELILAPSASRERELHSIVSSLIERAESTFQEFIAEERLIDAPQGSPDTRGVRSPPTLDAAYLRPLRADGTVDSSFNEERERGGSIFW